jgi:hypothetical protein
MSLPAGALAETVQAVPALVAAQPGEVAVRFTVASGAVCPLSVIATDCVLGETYLIERLAVLALGTGTVIANESVPTGPEPVGAGVVWAFVPPPEAPLSAPGVAEPPPPPPHAAMATTRVPAAQRRPSRAIVISCPHSGSNRSYGIEAASAL